jgi:hypothetical protein
VPGAGSVTHHGDQFDLPCKRRQRLPWPVPRRGRRTSGAGLQTYLPA